MKHESNTHSPEWLIKINHTLTEASNTLSLKYQALLTVSKKTDDYSEKILHARIIQDKKAQQSYPETLKKLESEAQSYQKLTQHNLTLYASLLEAEKLRFAAKTHALKTQRNELTAQLIQSWNEKIKQDMDLAEKKYQLDLTKKREDEKKFENAKREYHKTLKPNVNSALLKYATKLYEDFNVKHKHIATALVDIDYKKQTFTLLGLHSHIKIPVKTQCEPFLKEEEFNQKPITALVEIAKKIPQPDLVKQFSALEAATQLQQESEKIFQHEASTHQELKRLDVASYDQFIVDSTQLISYYQETSQQLTKESRETYQSINRVQAELLAHIKKEHKAREEDCLSLDRYKTFSQENNAIWEEINIKKFENNLTVSGLTIHSFEKKRDEINVMYIKANQQFDTERSSDRDCFAKTADEAIINLKTIKDQNKEKINNCKKLIEAYQLQKMQKHMVELLEKAIYHNIDFWHEQIWLRSRAKFKDLYKKEKKDQVTHIGIPIGIAEMNERFHVAATPAALLDLLQTTANNRTAPRNNLFNSRTPDTTGKFYDIVKNLKFNQYDESAVNRLQQALQQLKYVDRNKNIKRLTLTKSLPKKPLSQPGVLNTHYQTRF